MDNFDNSNASGSPNLNRPIPLGEDLDKPIPFDDGTGDASVSHSPLSLGGSNTAQAPRTVIPNPAVSKTAVQKTEMPKIAAPKPAVQKVETKKVSTNRITGVKTFFTKLHPGAMEFLDEQITKWLKGNPGVVIKRTNTVTGDIQAKKTEPNIIITVWY
ncbi:MAG: hypothetical protein OEW48_13260 [Phycisphaerae bacterium]|nr:hypothetical protein [Phycisphaerae bacterium]